MEYWTLVKEKAQHYYFLYSISTSVYMMEPLEATVVNTILVAVVAMVLYTSYLFLPGHALMIIHFLMRLIGMNVDDGTNGSTMNTPS